MFVQHILIDRGCNRRFEMKAVTAILQLLRVLSIPFCIILLDSGSKLHEQTGSCLPGSNISSSQSVGRKSSNMLTTFQYNRGLALPGRCNRRHYATGITAYHHNIKMILSGYPPTEQQQNSKNMESLHVIFYLSLYF